MSHTDPDVVSAASLTPDLAHKNSTASSSRSQQLSVEGIALVTKDARRTSRSTKLMITWGQRAGDRDGSLTRKPSSNPRVGQPPTGISCRRRRTHRLADPMRRYHTKVCASVFNEGRATRRGW